MKKMIFLVALAMNAALNAQEADTLDYTMCVASYDYTCRSTDADGQPKEVTWRMALQVGRKVACSMGYAEHADTLRREKMEEAKQHVPRTFQNWPEGKLTAHEVMPFERFVTTEAIGTVKWRLTTETDTLMGLACQKAVGEYGGRHWTVWFAPEIPSTAGPWRLHGLPGLILRAEADDAHHFDCFDIDFVKEPIVLPRSSDTKAKHSQFVKFRNRKIEQAALSGSTRHGSSLYDFDSLIPLSQIENVMVMGGSVLVNGIPMRDATVKFVPLELK